MVRLTFLIFLTNLMLMFLTNDLLILLTEKDQILRLLIEKGQILCNTSNTSDKPFRKRRNNFIN
jgi:hypothetical protein